MFMKTNRNLYLFAAALVAGTMGMTSCSNEEITPGNQNPTYNGESVKTQFAINIPAAGKTRMTGENTQNGGNFLGMRDIKLIPMTGDASVTPTFSSIINLPNIDNDEITNGTTNSKVYENVNVPVGTTNFLFYGVGGTTAPSDDDKRFAQGVLNSSMATSNVADIAFTLQGAKIADAGTQGDKILTVLKTVAQVNNWSTQSAGTTLGDLYTNFITLKAGSAASVCQTLENLYNSVDALAKGTDGAEKTIALAIQTAITSEGTFSVTGDGTSAPYELTTTLTYPRNINMPDGAAILSYESTGKTFSYNTTNPAIGTGLGVKMDDICFPAPIYYSVNTKLAASNSVPETWPSTLDNWKTFFDSWGSTVTTSTRAIALKKAIQYGVAQLELSVKCGGSLLEDSKGNSVSVPADGFKVTGVLIGGQPSKTGWNFEPYTAATFDKVVYDKAINGTVAAKADVAEGTNYTLVLDNKQETAQSVNIAIELENDAVDFYGKDGVVPNGSKFYLIAQLDPASKTVSDVTNPYVFMQDYKTKATLTIKSLKNAYNTIPDLRATQLSLGLAVDLDWKAGIVFDFDIN